MTRYLLSGLLDWGCSQDVSMIKGSLLEAWHRFLEGDSLEKSMVRPVIYEAWERCRANRIDYNLDTAPAMDTENRGVNGEKKPSILIEEARAALVSLGRTLQDKQSIAALCDKSGRILAIEGDSRFAGEVAEVKNFRVGVRWSEDCTGNNAIGTALSIGQPHQVVSAEHYCRGWHDYACTAVPICDPFSEEVLGVLDITGTISDFHRYAYGQILHVVRMIEAALYRKGVSREYFFNKEALRTINAMSSEGLIIIDANGAIRACSTVARKLLSEIPLADDDNILALVHGLLTGKHLQSERISEKSLSIRGRNFPVQIQPLIRNDLYLGTVIRFTECGSGSRRPVKKRPGRSTATIIGCSSSLEKARIKAEKVASYDSTVLLEGESGTGKELFARLIHDYSPRSKRPFIPLNCAAIPPQLMASELFGYDGGAFTGARTGGQIGKLEMGNGGTIFLDEIAEMPIEVQVSLLRFLQEREFYRLGGNRLVRPDVRIIAATNKPLKDEIVSGRFRKDLFYRLKVISIELPPLQGRREDIPELVEYFLQDLSSTSGRPVKRLDDAAMSAFMVYSWPGNVRELRNAVEHGFVMSEGDRIGIRDLPKEIVSADGPCSSVSHSSSQGDDERAELLTVLENYGWNISRTARDLGIARVTLYRRMKRLGISVVKHMSHP